MCQCRKESVICLCQEDLKWDGRKPAASVNRRFLIPFLFILSICSFCWEISAFFMSHSWLQRIALKNPMLPKYPPLRMGGLGGSTTLYNVFLSHIIKAVVSALHSPSSLSTLFILVFFSSRRKKRKKDSHLFHHCCRFSAVSTTTQAENSPQKEEKNKKPSQWRWLFLGCFIIGVSGASSQCLCIRDMQVWMIVHWGRNKTRFLHARLLCNVTWEKCCSNGYVSGCAEFTKGLKMVTAGNR